MRWTIGVVFFLLEQLGFESLRKERVCPSGKDKAWKIRAVKDGKEYEGFGVNARLAFEDLIGKWLKEVKSHGGCNI